jgi:hypothetical protein
MLPVFKPHIRTNLKGKISEVSEALRHMKVVDVVCDAPVWRMLRNTLAYFVFLLAELDSRRCETVVVRMARVELEN